VARPHNMEDGERGDCAPPITTGGGSDLIADVLQAEVTEPSVQDADAPQLSHEFYDAYKATRRLLEATDDPADHCAIEQLSAKLKAIAARVGQLRLFSVNEELDDISTADLKFLLVPSLLADVLGATRDMDERLPALRQALVFWRAFAADCQRLGIAHRDDMRAIDRDAATALDPASKRDEKIDRHKRGKELDEKAAYLFSKKRQALGDEFHWGHGSSFDEDMERDLILALLQRAVASAAGDIDSAQQEMPLLEMMLARGGPGMKMEKEPPVSAEKPFIVKIQDKAECMRLYKEMVFQCPFSRPTMTLAECAEIEMGQMREGEERRADQQRRAQAENDDRWWQGDRYGAQDDHEDDQKTYKDRDWDDWKDEHPWGSGNKMANVA